MIERRHQSSQQQRIDSEYQFSYQRSQDHRRGKSSFRITIDDKDQQMHLTHVENEYEYYVEEKNISYQQKQNQKNDID